MTLVAGVDTSTQSTKVLVCDADTGAVLREGRAGHPDGTEVAPAHWWHAFEEATAGGLLDGVAAIGVGGQQHGMVLLDEAGEVVRDALLWNDTRPPAPPRTSSPSCPAARPAGRRPPAAAGGELHRHQAALGGPARAGGRGARRGRRPAARLDHAPAARRQGRRTDDRSR
ncbi:FGGY family carbohydrate kinase [Dactylosporangium darangshiense]|uniref:FGGY family carbohydrate kinase n=1 Tax=Dactylosporangium darangshiense TaxID=579108 RepID=UPI00363D3FC0